MNLGDLMAQAWDDVIRDTPDPFDAFDVWSCTTYRERLDRRRYNMRGDLIPQITLVRRNLSRLGKTRPTLPD